MRSSRRCGYWFFPVTLHQVSIKRINMAGQSDFICGRSLVLTADGDDGIKSCFFFFFFVFTFLLVVLGEMFLFCRISNKRKHRKSTNVSMTTECQPRTTHADASERSHGHVTGRRGEGQHCIKGKGEGGIRLQFYRA